jgi:hypothetical protein
LTEGIKVDKLKRIGTILIVLGLSLLLIAVVRGGSSEIGQTSLAIPPTKQRDYDKFLYPRDLRLEIEAPTPITFKLVAPSGQSIVDLQDPVNSVNQFYHLGERGIYHFSVYNPSNVTTNVRIITTFYNFESDLVESSFILIAVGAIFIVSSYFATIARRKRILFGNELGRKKTAPSIKSDTSIIS